MAACNGSAPFQARTGNFRGIPSLSLDSKLDPC